MYNAGREEIRKGIIFLIFLGILGISLGKGDSQKQIFFQLMKEGGRLVIPVGEDLQELKLIIKEKEDLITQGIIPVRFVLMRGVIENSKKQ